MSRIDEMIARLCPDGVEYRALGDMLLYEQPGKYLVKNTNYDGAYNTPVLTAGKTFILGYTDEQDGIYPASEQSPVILLDDFTTANRWIDFPFKVKSSATKMLQCKDVSIFNFRYLYYLMQVNSYSPMEHTRQWISTFSKIEVPIPPMEIQDEIVRILDSFVKLEAELEAELEARKAQYAYYRDQLLDFTDRECSWLRLGEIGTFMRGRRFTKSDYRASGIPSIHYADIYTKLDTWTDTAVAYLDEDKHDVLRYAQPGDVVIACTGEDSDDIAKAVAWLGDKPVAVHDDCAIFHHQQNPKYISYLFQTHRFAKFKKRYATEAKMTRLSAERIAQFEVPVPSLAEQQRIVDILDRFDALTMSLTDGLPAEIEARRRQYEYYRDRLLDFPKKE